jgi:DNA modification methylase
MVAVFAEVRRVLKPNGTCWLNLGDSYIAPRGNTAEKPGFDSKAADGHAALNYAGTKPSGHLKVKDLAGIPWRVAFALQADGWYLRSDIIWSKPNPMPESVTDRPTKSHEYLFLLTKSARYYFDADAVREKATWVDAEGRPIDSWGRPVQKADHHLEGRRYSAPGLDPIKGGRGVPQSLGSGVTDGRRNIRSVWTIATRPYPGAHFAVFPPELPERCIKAGSSEKGVCPECGAPWERTVGRPCRECGGFIATQGNSCPLCGHVNDWKAERGISKDFGTTDWSTPGRATPRKLGASGKQGAVPAQARLDQGWSPMCDHHTNCPVPNIGEPCAKPAVILDPFGGSGTTAMVAQKLGRRAILVDLNPTYIVQQMERNAQVPLGLTEGDAA